MSSPSMDNKGGYRQADLDLRRGDTFAILNFPAKVLDWNMDPTAWQAGYAERLHQALTNTAMRHQTSLDLTSSPD